MRVFIFLVVAVISMFVVSGEVQARHHGSKKIASEKKARRLPAHFQGSGVFIWNEIYLDGNDYAPYVEMAKANHMSYVIIKAFDGKEWGVKKNGKFHSQLNNSMITAFHREGIKCYGYGSTYLHPRSDVAEQSRHAINLLHKTGADGIVMDDVFAYGSDARQAEKLFSNVRKHVDSCSKCRKKTLSFSTFPSVWRRELPWHIPLKYCDYYMPQLYWTDNRKSPAEEMSRFQKGWSAYASKNGAIQCKVVPVAPTKNVHPRDIEEFVLLSKQAGYPGVTYFRWDKTNVQGWRAIKKSARKKV